MGQQGVEMTNKRLTEKDYWEVHTKTLQKTSRSATKRSLKSRIVDKYFGKVKRGYSRYLLYDIECKTYFPKGKLKIIEVGSAPGNELITFHKKFGYIPYGVEYNETGAELNRRVFAEHKIDQDNVIHADFFDDEFQNKYRDQFDIVMSQGFIEHFTDIEEVVNMHANLLKPNGFLFITIPNFRWFNYLLILFFAKNTIKAHNLKIMKRKTFLSYFDSTRFEILTCKYFGTLDFGLIYGRNKSKPKLILMDLLMKLQRVVDFTLYLFFKRGFIESFLFSPRLMIICRKKQTFF